MNLESNGKEESSKSVKELLNKFENKSEDENKFKKPPVISRNAPPPPPKLPPHRPPPHQNNLKTNGPKPQIAPKPNHLNELISSTSSSDLPQRSDENPSFSKNVQTTPTIMVSAVTKKKVSKIEEGCETESVNTLETLGIVPRKNYGMSIERPVSELSTLSQISDDFDDGDTTATEDESSTIDTRSDDMKRLSRNRDDDFCEELPLPRQERKNTVCTNTHSEIMHEMEEEGYVNQHGNSKKKTTLRKTRRKSNFEGAEIPSDIGKLRVDRKGRHNSLFVPTSASLSPSDFSTFSSMLSDRSSITTAESGENEHIIPDYDTGNDEENKRLKKLHFAAVEFQKVQNNYVRYLKEMTIMYPEYMERFGKRIGKDLLLNHNGHENVVLQIKKVLLQVLPSHEMMLNEINHIVSTWNSEYPCMSKTIFMYADFLKCCQPFLDKKADFSNQLIGLRNENKEFDEATYMFETEVFKRGKKGAVIQQLDQVHQNFMRYKLLMLRYSEYLEDETEEKARALATIEKLEKVTQAVNQKMGLPTTEELTKLYYKFQGQFNVWLPGRRLIRQGDVMKQTRKEEQPRYLVLFTDVLWICRNSSTISLQGQFEMYRSYGIPLEGCRIETSDHEDYARSLIIKSKVKSAILIFSTEKEKNVWNDDIMKAIADRKKFKRRQSEAISKVQENRRRMRENQMNDDGLFDDEEEGSDRIERPGLLGENGCRTSSNSTDGLSSIPVTPIDDDYINGHSESPTTSGSSTVVKKSTLDVKPVWLPDNISTECLMEGCSKEFSILNRRHHCRDCGWLICKDCKGKAPLSKYEYQKQNVCPECFGKINKLYLDGVLFPSNRLVASSDGTFMVRTGTKAESVIEEPRKLFKAPFNYLLKKRNLDEKRNSAIVSSKIFLRNRRNAESVQYALLKHDLRLIFYRAELDSKSVFDVLIHGYFYREKELNGNGWLFELIHRNQIRTEESKDDLIVFRVDNSISAKKWSTAFQEKLSIDPMHFSSS